MWSTKRVTPWLCNWVSNTINKCTCSWEFPGQWHSSWCAQAKICEALPNKESRLFRYGVAAVYTITTKVHKAIIGCIGLQKIHIFMWTRRSMYQDLLSDVDRHTRVKLDRSFFKEALLAVCASKWSGHPFYLPFISSTGMSRFTLNKMATPRYHRDVSSYLDKTHQVNV
jgi:hypothetical protein